MQASRATVRQIDADGSLEFWVTGGVPAEVVRRIPVEAEAVEPTGRPFTYCSMSLMA